MKGWKEVQLKSITSKIGSGVTPKGGASVYIDKGTALIRSQNIYNGSFEYKGLVFVNEITAYKMIGVEIFKNDILINITGDSVARCTIVPDNLLPARVNQHVAIIRCKEDVDSAFVMYSLTSPIYQAKLLSIATGAGATRNALTKVILEDFKINLPPLPIQLKVSSILSAYDNLIENNLKRIKLLEELAQRTYEEWFVKFRINGKQLKLNKETGLPEGWTFGSLKELVSFQNGFAFKSSKFTAEGQPVIKIKNIGNNTIDVTNTDCVDEDYAKTAEKFQVNEGDLLIAMTGATVGKVGYLPYSVKKCYLNQRVGRFINLKGSSNIHFVFSVMTQGSGLQQVLNLASGAAQPNISGDQILSLQTVIPTSDLLKNFNEIAETNIKQILTLLNQNRLLKESRDILLPRLMSGVIEVKA